MKVFLSLCILTLLVVPLRAQNFPDVRVNARAGDHLADVFVGLEKINHVRFFYEAEWLRNFPVNRDYTEEPLESFLASVFAQSEYSWKFMFGYAVIVLRDPQAIEEYQSTRAEAVERRRIIETVTIGTKSAFVPGKKLTLRGKIVDRKENTGQPDITIMLNNKVAGLSDSVGNYAVTVTGGDYLLSFRSVNFEEKVVDLHLYESGRLNAALEEGAVMLQEVVVGGQNIVKSNTGLTTVNLVDLRRSAALFGEVDVIRQVQNQPGVVNTGEVAGGFNVRGGGVDQNLVLFDDVPVFNTYHGLGFFSSFNSESIGKVSFLKGGIPAQYGGRVSSVLSISSRSGDSQEWHGGGGVGILSTHLYAGGPVRKDKTTIFISARGSYSDWVLNTFRSNYTDLRNSSLAFADGSFRLDHRFSQKATLTVSAYSSFDRFTLSTDTTFSYRTSVGTLRYRYQFSNRFSGSVKLSYGQYGYQFSEPQPQSAYDLKYGFIYPSADISFNYDGRHQLSFGWQSILYDFQPGTLRPTSPESNSRRLKMPVEKSLETALYISDELEINPQLAVVAGIRFSLYSRLGAGTVYKYAPGKPREVYNITDSVKYGHGDRIQTYSGLEPRISLRYSLSDDDALKAAYNRVYQYLHLVSNTAAVTPVDIWQSSNSYFRPQTGDQWSLGYFRNGKERSYEFSAEAFYKTVNNILDFKDGANLILNKHLETALLHGKSTSYGAELSVVRTRGRLQGSANYTWSRSLRRVSGRFSNESINNGREYAANFDQPHVLNAEWRYGISRRHFFSGNFTYHTGRPMSVPESYYMVDGVPVMNFSDRNKYRIPDYHRLDIAFIIEGNHKRRKIFSGTWALSIYNIYFRKNAYSVFYKPDSEGQLRPYKLTVIGTAVPSVSYSFKF